MSDTGLSSGTNFLRDAAKKYFEDTYQNPAIYLSQEVDASLKWQPSLHFKLNDHLVVIGEASETPYPMIFSLRRVELENLLMPASVYCVCPEEAYLADQAEAKRLIAHGYGLLTVAIDGTVQKRASCIPIIQQISEASFKEEIKALPKKLRQRAAESFDRYKHSAPGGAADLAEVIEGLVLKAAKDAAAKGWITNQQAKKPASALAAMTQAPQCQNALAAIGAAQGFISQWRNASHHFPKDKRQAAKKYRECRHAFLDGLKQANFFRNSMRSIGLSGTLP